MSDLQPRPAAMVRFGVEENDDGRWVICAEYILPGAAVAHHRGVESYATKGEAMVRCLETSSTFVEDLRAKGLEINARAASGVLS